MARSRTGLATIVHAFGLAACNTAAGDGLSGTYTNAEGNSSIEFLGGGKAHVSVHGVGGECSYTQSGRHLDLTCDGEATEFTIGDDGALAGPPDSFLSRTKKSD
jgi:hypothetical protein